MSSNSTILHISKFTRENALIATFYVQNSDRRFCSLLRDDFLIFLHQINQIITPFDFILTEEVVELEERTNLATHIRLLFLAQLFFAFAFRLKIFKSIQNDLVGVVTFRVTRFNGTEELAQSTW